MKKENSLQELEKALNLRYIRPVQNDIYRLEDTLHTIGYNLGGETPQLQVPDRFLINPLNSEQLELIEDVLGPIYARESVALQDSLRPVQIDENREPMANLARTMDAVGAQVSFSEKPFHEACGEWAGKPRVFWAREGVAHNLTRHALALNQVGLIPHYEDAFRPSSDRPYGVQEGLFVRRMQWVMEQFPNLPFEEQLTEARSKTAVAPWIAGHTAGAAVDITLRRMDGTPLYLGNEYPQGGALVALDFPYLTQEQWTTRQLFAQSMRMAGMTVYPGEDWHGSSGDVLSAVNLPADQRSSYTTSYGPIKGFDPVTGDVFPFSRDKIYRPYFTEEQLRALIDR